MKQEVRRQIREHIGPTLGLQVVTPGDLMYDRHFEWITSGYSLSWSDSSTFYVHVFAQALVTPVSNWVLTVSDRLPVPGSTLKRWRRNATDNLMLALQASEGRRTELATLSGYRHFMATTGDPRGVNPIVQEEILYLEISSSEEKASAGSEVRRIEGRLDNLIDLARRYPGQENCAAIEERAAYLRSNLPDMAAIRAGLRRWRDQAVTNLKIDRTPSAE